MHIEVTNVNIRNSCTVLDDLWKPSINAPSFIQSVGSECSTGVVIVSMFL